MNGELMSYDRIVSAALAETTSKFRLAEALALDIPPRHRGPSDEATIPAYLEEARQAIIAAGGESRSVDTLSKYRRTALWVLADLGQNFRWVSGLSFSAHNEARMAGISYQDFAASPRSVEVLRREVGKASADGPPETIVRNWTSEQRAIAARELLADPEVADIIDTEMGREPTPAQVADQIAADPAARSAAREAIARHDQRRDRRPPDSGDEPANPLSLVWEFRQLHRTIDRIATEVSKRGAIVGAAERDALLEEVAWLRSALEMIEGGIRGGSVDDALARILAGGA